MRMNELWPMTFAALNLRSPLPVLRERVRVRVISAFEWHPTLEITLPPSPGVPGVGAGDLLSPIDQQPSGNRGKPRNRELARQIHQTDSPAKI